MNPIVSRFEGPCLVGGAFARPSLRSSSPALQIHASNRTRRSLLPGAALVVALFASACAVPRPVMPDGSSRVPVNTDARMNAYREQFEESDALEAERVRWAREVGAMREQISRLQAATIILAAEAEGKAASPIAKAAAHAFNERSALALARGSDSPGTAPADKGTMGARMERKGTARPDAPGPVMKVAARLDNDRHMPVAGEASVPPATVIAPASEPVRLEARVIQDRDRAASLAPLRPAQPVEQRTAYSSNALVVPSGSPILGVQSRASDPEIEHPLPTQARSIRFELAQTAVGSPGFAASAIEQQLLASARSAESVVIRSRWPRGDASLIGETEAQRRAERFREYLVARGVDAARIWINTAAEDRVGNRRGAVLAGGRASAQLPPLQVDVTEQAPETPLPPQHHDGEPALARARNLGTR